MHYIGETSEVSSASPNLLLIPVCIGMQKLIIAPLNLVLILLVCLYIGASTYPIIILLHLCIFVDKSHIAHS